MFIPRAQAQPPVPSSLKPRPYQWLIVVLLIALLLGVPPAAADITRIDPAAPPAPVLEPAEREKLVALLQWTQPLLLSEVSPDDSAVLLAHLKLGPELQGAPPRLEFLNVRTGTRVPVAEPARALPPMSNVAWRDARTAVYISFDPSRGPLQVALDRLTGAVVTRTLELPGFPFEHRPLAPNGSRLLVMLPPEPAGEAGQPGITSLFYGVMHRSSFARPGAVTTSSQAATESLRLTSEAVTLAVFDLTSEELVPLMTLPAGTGVRGEPAWSADGSKLALVRMRVRGTPTSAEDLAVQDALGNLPPAQNPFFQSNIVDVFDLERGEFQPAALRAATGDGPIFSQMAWSPDGETLMAQLKHPAQLVDRRYPTYLNAERVSVRFYNSELEPIATLDRRELGGPRWSFARWLSPDEALVYAPSGMNWRLYVYNHVSGHFRQLPLPDGTYYHEIQSTHHSRELILVHSSFLQPYEVYRANWDGSGLTALTQLNARVAALDNIRADRVSFRMKGGATRSGYLLQPADAAFPPKNVPIVLWQEGGPGNTMTNQWGGMVSHPFNLLPNFGIPVLVLPLPGREGYGPAFYNALSDGRNFGAVDIDEGVEAVEQMIKRGWTSRGRVGLTGCSYGGYFTAQSITRHPHIYGAANPQCSLLDLTWLWEEDSMVDAAMIEGRTPADDPSGEYLKDSPLRNAARVRTPLLMFHGEEDYLPVSLAIDFHNQVEATGTPAELLTFEGERHALALPESNLVAGQAQIQWFRQYLRAP